MVEPAGIEPASETSFDSSVTQRARAWPSGPGVPRLSGVSDSSAPGGFCSWPVHRV